MTAWRLDELTRTEAAERAGDGVVVVPVAAIEQHGPHLPVGVDRMLADAVADAACSRHAERLLRAPTVVYGSSDHHLPFAGTMSLSGQTLTQVLVELGRSLSSWGARKVFFLNGHAGNEAICNQAVRELVLVSDLTVAAASYWTLAWEPLVELAAGGDAFGFIPGHAGAFETSLMLHIAPRLVDLEVAKQLEARPNETFSPVHPMAKMFIQRPGWMASVDGVTESPAAASAELGEQLFEVIVREVSRSLLRLDDAA